MKNAINPAIVLNFNTSENRLACLIAGLFRNENTIIAKGISTPKTRTSK